LADISPTTQVSATGKENPIAILKTAVGPRLVRGHSSLFESHRTWLDWPTSISTNDSARTQGKMLISAARLLIMARGVRSLFKTAVRTRSLGANLGATRANNFAR
jgi:hypothetical protein